MAERSTAVESAHLTLRLTQQVNASPERVFDALLDPKSVGAWMGPRTMVEACIPEALDPHVGGVYRLRMRRRADSPRGPGDQVVTGVYREIDRPRRLVFTWQWEDEVHQSLVTFNLRPSGGGTEVTLVHENLPTPESRDGHNRGWAGCQIGRAHV